MPREHVVRRVPQSVEQMFNLVADVERYPEFLPGCRDLRVVTREGSMDAGLVTARMRVGYRFISEHFTCRVSLNRAGQKIVVSYVDGPLSHLENTWIFSELDQGCEVDFTIAFELSSRRLGVIVNALFDRVFLRFIDAFETRAQDLHPIYGRRRVQPA